MCLFKKAHFLHGLSKSPINFIGGGSGSENHCLEVGKIQTGTAKRNVCISTGFLCDRMTELIELVLFVLFNHLGRSRCRFRGEQMRKHLGVFVESALVLLPDACPTFFWRTYKAKHSFLLSLKCHEQLTQCACRGWYSAEGCGAQERRPPSPNCPKPHPVQKEKTCTFSSGGAEAL